MHNRRVWILVFLFLLSSINYIDRVALSLAGKSIATEFNLSSVELGYLFSSFLWLYVICLIPMGLIVDRFGTRLVNHGRHRRLVVRHDSDRAGRRFRHPRCLARGDGHRANRHPIRPATGSSASGCLPASAASACRCSTAARISDRPSDR